MTSAAQSLELVNQASQSATTVTLEVTTFQTEYASIEIPKQEQQLTNLLDGPKSKANQFVVRAEDYYYAPGNVTRATLSGINAYRSALTLDWLSAEDTRQRELVAAYETEPSAPVKIRNMECVDSPRPSTRKVGKLMLELLKNLEGDDGILVPELTRVLIRSKLFMETSILESEPDLESLMKTPMMIMGEPHVSFPRILAIVWMLVTDATTTRNDGWCSIKKVNEYMGSSKPTDIAKHLRVLEPVVARARFIMEEFIQNMTPLNLHQEEAKIKIPKENKSKQQTTTDEISDVLVKLPRATGEKDEKQDDQKEEELSDLDMEYASTRVLEQAQQFSDLEDVTPVCGGSYGYLPWNATREMKSGMQAYRSALTLDWLTPESTVQRKLVTVYQTESSVPTKLVITECVNYPRPSAGKIAKLMLELLKNLEGDEGILMPKLIQMLVRSKMLVEMSMLDSEPDLESLVKTPTMMMGEPLLTFPRILAIVWMLVTDAATTRASGWCSINKMTEYLATTKPRDIAKHMRVLEPVMSRARYIMEEFIQEITPLNINQKKPLDPKARRFDRHTTTETNTEDTDDTLAELLLSSEEDAILQTTTDKQSHGDTEESAELPRVSGEEILQTTTDEQSHGDAEVFAELPRASGEQVTQKDEKERELTTLDLEYASTQVLEQAQLVAKILNVAPESRARRSAIVVHVYTLSTCILSLLL